MDAAMVIIVIIIIKSSQVAFNKNEWQSHKYYMQKLK